MKAKMFSQAYFLPSIAIWSQQIPVLTIPALSSFLSAVTKQLETGQPSLTNLSLPGGPMVLSLQKGFQARMYLVL